MTLTYTHGDLHAPSGLRWWIARDSEDVRPHLTIMGLVDDLHPVTEMEYLDVRPLRSTIAARCEALAQRERDRAEKARIRKETRRAAA